MKIDEIEKRYDDVLKSIKVCKDKEFKESVLILMYSMIDALSWLNSSEKEITNRNVKLDFINFCEKYIIDELSQNIMGEELYNARCAIVHTLSARSKNNKKNSSRYICYSNNDDAVDEGNGLIETLQEDAVCVNIIELLAVLVKAKTNFFFDINNDEEKKKIVISKSDEYYSIM